MQYKPYKQKFGVSLDWETSGSEWGGDSSKEHQGVSFGAVIFDTKTFDEVDSIYREIIFDPNNGLKWQGLPYKWDQSAERIHGLSREYLLQNGITQEEAATDLLGLIMEYCGSGILNTPENKNNYENLLFLGHNSGFDVRFTNQLLVSALGAENFENVYEQHALKYANTLLDTSGIGYIMFGLHRSDDIFDFLGLPERKEHNALEDARITLKAAKTMRMLADIALGI